MSKNLQILLGITTPSFHTAMQRLESSTGGAAIDTKLLGDILKRAHAAMRQIGLDPRDTTAEELYHALVSYDDAPAIFAKTQYAGLIIDGHVVSLNYEDVTRNRRRAFATRQLDGLRECLAEEVVARYTKHPQTNEKLVAAFAKDAGIIRSSRKAAPKHTKLSVVPSILMIGDIFTDAFIKLDDETTRVDIDKDGSKRLSLPFGTKPPYDHVDIVKSVGPSPNAAVSTARLGLDVSLMAWVGDDATGQEAIEHLDSEHVNTDSMITETGKLTSYWYVLRYGADRTMLVKSEKYRYQWRNPRVTPDWIYLSYIGEDSWPLHEKLIDYLGKNPSIKFVLQPGTFQFKWGAKKMAKLYKRAEIVVMNREEAVDVTGASYDSLKQLADAMHALGPKIVVITDGPSGSYASYDGKLVTMPNYPDIAPPLERTGAGDAFASTIVAALALGETMETALTWAPINSMSVVQQIGAQKGLLHRKEIEKYLKQAPKNYKPTEMK